MLLLLLHTDTYAYIPPFIATSVLRHVRHPRELGDTTWSVTSSRGGIDPRIDLRSFSSLRRYRAVIVPLLCRHYGSPGFRSPTSSSSHPLVRESGDVCHLCHFKSAECERARGKFRGRKVSSIQTRTLNEDISFKFPTSPFELREGKRLIANGCARRRVNICICNLSPMSFT